MTVVIVLLAVLPFVVFAAIAFAEVRAHRAQTRDREQLAPLESNAPREALRAAIERRK